VVAKAIQQFNYLPEILYKYLLCTRISFISKFLLRNSQDCCFMSMVVLVNGSSQVMLIFYRIRLCTHAYFVYVSIKGVFYRKPIKDYPVCHILHMITYNGVN
jgi:hypothetical protein